MSSCIVLATDQNYVQQACVSIASYALSHPAQRFAIQVLIHNVDTAGVQLLKTTAAAFGLTLGIIPIDLEWTTKLPEAFRAGMRHVSPMTYSKLIALEYIPAHYSKCLMLDTDLLVVGALDELLSTDLAGFPIASVPDFMMPIESGTRLGLKNPSSYFNCGVLLMDRSNWNKCAPLSKMSDVVKNHASKICYGDQDILNIIFEGNYLPLHHKYNHMHMVSLAGLIPNNRLQGTTPAILHFPGQIKPWHEYAPRNLQAIYFRYAAACQWIGMRLAEPATIQETKIAAMLSEKLGNKNLFEKYVAKLK
jgi:lipopolysaccharide biosynthesis glycosyltransferase